MAKRLIPGLNPLAYVGVNPLSPANVVEGNANVNNGDPRQDEYQNFELGDQWINSQPNATPAIFRIWELVSKKIPTPADPTPTHWVLISSGVGSVDTLTANSGGPVAPLLGNINVVGDTTTINIVGNPATHTLTVSAIGTGVVSSFVTDNGTATPIAGVIGLFAQPTVPRAGASVSFSVAATNNIFLNTSDASQNTLIGFSAGNGTLSGAANTGLGQSALHALTTGTNNSGFGTFSAASVTSGNSNTAIGEGSLINLLTGSNNIAIGLISGSNYTTTESSNVLLGNLGVLADNHIMRLGTTGNGAGQVTTTYIAGAVNIGAPLSGAALTVTAASNALAIDAVGSVAIETGFDLTVVSGTTVFGNTQVNNSSPVADFRKQRGAGVIVTGDALGSLNFQGYDANTVPMTGGFTVGAAIEAVSNGTIGGAGAQRVPASLQFFTFPDVASGPLKQRMVISSAGNVTVNAADSGVSFTTAGSVAAGGDEGGTAAYNTLSNANVVAGVGVNTLTGTAIGGGAQTNAGYIKMYVGVTAVYVPYYLTP